MLIKDATRLGVWLGAFFCTLWWSIDWSRYIRRNLRIDPPYHPWLKIVIRGLLALFVFGSFLGLVAEWPPGIRSATFYGTVLGMALILFAAVHLLLTLRERVPSGKQRS